MEDLDFTPREGEYSLTLPITIDKVKGRETDNSNKILGLVIFGAVFIILCILFCMSDTLSLVGKLIRCGGVFLVGTTVLRFTLFKEKQLVEETRILEKNDYMFDSKLYWDIFSIDEAYPYISHFKDGSIGIFVKLVKGVIVNPDEINEFQHYRGIESAFNLLGELKIKVKHLDIMDSLLNDNRYQELYNNLDNVKSPTVKEVYAEIWKYNQDIAEGVYSCEDYYAITYKGSEDDLMHEAEAFLDAFLEGNYVSYIILDRTELRDLTKSLENLDTFSVVQACSAVYTDRLGAKNITPIKLTTREGEEILNKTELQLAQENKIKSRTRNNKRTKLKTIEDTEIDIFED